MKMSNIHEAKTYFSKLIASVERGEEVVISKAGHPVAKLVPFNAPKKRKAGALKGKIWYDAPLDQGDEDLAQLFGSSPLFPEDK